ncbi:MAG: hypothetical protein NT163_03635 [Chlorobiales bacterium]|nr:hypothetical protein [Chlorobiales bacterium]
MDIGTGKIIRRICRSLEVLLFFVISVVGFNVLVKTTSFNTKSKPKFLSRGMVAFGELSPELYNSLHYHDLESLTGFFSFTPPQQSRSFTKYSGTPPFPDILGHHYLVMPHSGSNQKQNDLSLSAPRHKPDNLLQQNPVLLI